MEWGMKHLQNINVDLLIEKIRGGKTQAADTSFYNKYGLRRNLIFITNSNKFISIDSMTGSQIWRLALKDGESIISAIINSDNNIDLVFSRFGHKLKTQVSSEEGRFLVPEEMADMGVSKYINNLHSDNQVEIGFSNAILNNNLTSYVFYRVEPDSGVSGYLHSNSTGNKGEFEEVWNYNLCEDESIIGYSYHLKDNEHYLNKIERGFITTIPEEEALYFKVVDPSNIALLIKQKDIVDSRSSRSSSNGIVTYSLKLVVLNTDHGKVLKTIINSDVDFSKPISFIYDDNGIFVSYFNKRALSFEIWSVEVFKQKIEHSFSAMLNMYVFKVKKEETLDYDSNVEQFIFLEKKYGLDYGIKYLTAVNSPLGLTKRNLIGITLNDDIVSIDRILLSSRRSTEEELKNPKLKKKHHSSVFSPYKYNLPHSYTQNLNANWRLNGLKNIKIVESKFESTSLVIAYGRDVFLTKVQPDNSFDLLSEDFNYILLMIMTVVITVRRIILTQDSSDRTSKSSFEF